MEARAQHPVFVVDGAYDAMQALSKATKQAGLPDGLAELVHLRASQINGCSVCVDMHAKALLKDGEPTEKVIAVAAWRETPFFDPAERAALALAEEMTRLADRADAVSDETWTEAMEHFDDRQLAALTIEIAQINFWNRLNAATRQPVGAAW